ncbi:hypothetical protein L3X39_02110 [Sabulilitoribacter multivorans]|uniref:Uncharacterized protein n=1 Tax=Flaviramulus multivorans TaxID=1304750 RepID=A0ABS9IG60_9FLAO|nr:hypothetical protein [Flaviramulus multivorans]MCF7559415.1 hypothetical protein [Flaviramulus multivorans]
MKYTKYFSGVLRNQGVPNLNVEQYARIMNIVSLEGRLQELLDLKATILNREEYYKYDLRINRITNKIKELSLNALPKELMQIMIFNSNKEH